MKAHGADGDLSIARERRVEKTIEKLVGTGGGPSQTIRKFEARTVSPGRHAFQFPPHFVLYCKVTL